MKPISHIHGAEKPTSSASDSARAWLRILRRARAVYQGREE